MYSALVKNWNEAGGQDHIQAISIENAGVTGEKMADSRGAVLKGKQIDMTEGVIWKQLLLFSIPLILSELFQQMYNTADSIIVGNFVSKQALAAVGATSNVINVIIGFFIGFSSGATVVIARFFGARQENELKRAIHTTILFTLILGVIFTGVGILGTPLMLELLGTPQDVYTVAKTYLQIYFSGISALVMYIMCTGILRAIGDSRSPLYVLVLTSIINVVLDLIFILVFHMGVAGAAWATVIAQVCSCVFLIIRLCNAGDSYRLELACLRIDKPLLVQVIGIGLPIGLQRSIIAFSNTIVLSFINRFGSGAMAGWSVHSRLDQIITKTSQSLSVATTTFVSQNIGADKRDRVKKGVRAALYLAFASTCIYAVFFVGLNEPLIRLFNRDPDVLYYGKIIITVLAPMQLINTFGQIQAGALRGQGDSKAPMFIMLFSHVILRQIYLNIGWNYSQTMYFVISCYPVGWLFSCIIIALYTRMKNKHEYY